MAHDRGGGSYQTLINAALRDHVEADQGHLERTLRGVIRLSTYLDSVVRRRRRSVIGGMLLRAIEHVQRAGADPRTFFGRIFGEEKNLTDPAGALATFDCVIANPPFSLKEWGREVWDADPWGRAAFGLPPASYGDYAWVQQMVASMAADAGRMAVVLPQGTLFRKGAEDRIRRALLEQDLIEAVIGGSRRRSRPATSPTTASTSGI